MAISSTSYIKAIDAGKRSREENQVGQHVHVVDPYDQDNLVKSRVFNKEPGNSKLPIHLRPGNRDKSVTQRFLEGHADAKAGKIQIAEPQQAKLAVQKTEDLRKLQALLGIVKTRVEQLEHEELNSHLQQMMAEHELSGFKVVN